MTVAVQFDDQLHCGAEEVDDPGIPSDACIAARVEAIRPMLDVDGDGVVDVATDIICIARCLLMLPAVPPSFRVLDPLIPPDSEICARVSALCP
jgi:hypothetical protein